MNAPNVNVIVAKIPTFGTMGSHVYTTPARVSAVSDFNAGLQDLVNDRRALVPPQNVFLADMFTVVHDSDLPDAVHPNCVGLEKMAQEWLLRFQAIY